MRKTKADWGLIQRKNYRCIADIIVNNTLILKLKAAEGLVVENEFQLVNYLKATEIEVGLLLNFGKTPQFKRKLFTSDRKTIDSENE